MTGILVRSMGVLLCASLACQSPTEPPRPAVATCELLHTEGPVILDTALQNESLLGHRVKIVLEDHGQRRTPGGTNEVWVRLRNVTDFDQHIQARAHFLSNTGEHVEDPSAWQRVFLPAKSIETYRAISKMREEVQRFYVELREGR